MAQTEPRPKQARRVRRIVTASLIAALVILAHVAGGYVYFLEHTAYTWDISSCYSDNMWALKDGLEDYCREHDGRMPATFDELRPYMKEKKGGPYDICVCAGEPFVWMPEGVATDDGCSVGNSLCDAQASHGRPVVLMCPPDSHGWLRKYAFGLARDDDGTFYFVRVRNGRATRFRR